MIPKNTQFLRHQASKCRDLARMAEEVGRRLISLAEDCDERAREVEHVGLPPPTENRLSSLSKPGDAVEPLTLSIKDTARLLGLGRSTIYRLIGERQLETVKIGNRTLFRTASIRNLVGDQG